MVTLGGNVSHGPVPESILTTAQAANLSNWTTTSSGGPTGWAVSGGDTISYSRSNENGSALLNWPILSPIARLSCEMKASGAGVQIGAQFGTITNTNNVGLLAPARALLNKHVFGNPTGVWALMMNPQWPSLGWAEQYEISGGISFGAWFSVEYRIMPGMIDVFVNGSRVASLPGGASHIQLYTRCVSGPGTASWRNIVCEGISPTLTRGLVL